MALNHNDYMDLMGSALASQEARDTLRKHALCFHAFPDMMIALVESENPSFELAGYFAGEGAPLSSFIMPKIEIQEIRQTGDGFTFIQPDGTATEKSYDKLRESRTLLPPHPEQRSKEMVENAFYRGYFESEESVVTDTFLGELKWERHPDGYHGSVPVVGVGTLCVSLKACSKEDLMAGISCAMQIIVRLAEYDRTARDYEDKGELSILTVYRSGAFDLRYDLDDAEYGDFLRVSFSPEGKVLDASYG